MIAPTLESDRLIFKPLSLLHLSIDYVNWMNDALVNRYLETDGAYTIEKLENYLCEVEKKDIFFWAIHLKDTSKHIGNIKIDPINEKHGVGEYGILMGDRAEWGRGYANEASKTIIDFCFNRLKIRKMTLGVVEDNEGAVKLYKNLGFSIEGILKDQGYYNDKLCNTFRMALFNNCESL